MERKALIDARMRKYLSREELAELVGVQPNTIYRWESGETAVPRGYNLRALCDALGTTAEALGLVELAPQETPLLLLPSPLPLNKPLKPPDDQLLHTLLEPSLAIVKMSWLLWAEGDVFPMADHLTAFIAQLEQIMPTYGGQFLQPALRIQAYAHEVLGKLAIEHLHTKEAIAHFQEMYDIAEELGDVDLLTLALVHQSEMLRRSHRYTAAIRRMERAEDVVTENNKAVSSHLQGVMWTAAAINYYARGDKNKFLAAIDQAEALANEIMPSVETMSSNFDKAEVLQIKGLGSAQFGDPEKAIEIYQQTDILRPHRPIRDQSSYHIIKAQAYCYAGDLQTGVKHALEGMELAEHVRSLRYLVRIQQMCQRLNATSLGKEASVVNLKKEVAGTLERMKGSIA